MENFEIVNQKSFKRKPQHSQDYLKYKNGILLYLFLETSSQNSSLQVCDIIRRLEFLYGRVRKATILEHLKRLYNHDLIDHKKYDILPKKKRRGGKVFYSKRILDTYPEAAKIIAKQNNKEDNRNNFIEGKYEIFVRISTRLTPGFIKNQKHEIARFFGFHNWYGGIIKENNREKNSPYIRIRKSYSSLEASRFRQKLKEDAAARRLEKSKELRPLNSFQGPNEDGKGSAETPPKPETTKKVSLFTDRGRTAPTTHHNPRV